MIIENPISHDHYLSRYWPLKPKLIDNNRRDDGDYFKKPTQYWFLNRDPKQNLIMEPLEPVPKKTVIWTKGPNQKAERSMISPQYANRFIRQYIL